VGDEYRVILRPKGGRRVGAVLASWRVGLAQRLRERRSPGLGAERFRHYLRWQFPKHLHIVCTREKKWPIAGYDLPPCLLVGTAGFEPTGTCRARQSQGWARGSGASHRGRARRGESRRAGQRVGAAVSGKFMRRRRAWKRGCAHGDDREAGGVLDPGPIRRRSSAELRAQCRRGPAFRHEH